MKAAKMPKEMRHHLSKETVDFIKRMIDGISLNSWFFLVTINRATGEVRHYPVRISEVDERLALFTYSDGMDCYFTPNAFQGRNSRTKNRLFSLHNVVIDVDCHMDNMIPSLRELRLERLVRLLRDQSEEMLIPTAVVYTGRGVQLWWHHDRLSVRACRGTWESVAKSYCAAIQNLIRESSGDDIMESLEGLEVDVTASTSAGRFFRLPGTMNTAAGCQAEALILSGDCYTQAELKKSRDDLRGYSPVLTAYSPKAHTRQKTAPDYVAWGKRVLSQIEDLRDYRNAPAGEELRNNFCYAYYCTARTAGYSVDESVSKTKLFNEGFRQPLSSTELRSTLSSSVRKDYQLSGQKIADLLGITDEEATFLCLKPYQKHESRKEKCARRYNEIAALYSANSAMTLKEVAEKSGTCVNTVKKALRKNGAFSHKTERGNKIVALRVAGWTAAQIAAAVGCCVRTVWNTVKRLATVIEQKKDELKAEGREAALENIASTDDENAECAKIVKNTPNNVYLPCTGETEEEGRDRESTQSWAEVLVKRSLGLANCALERLCQYLWRHYKKLLNRCLLQQHRTRRNRADLPESRCPPQGGTGESQPKSCPCGI